MDQRVKQICDIAGPLFIKNGFASTQIRDISKLSGISTGAIYSLFKDKTTIYECVIRIVTDDNFLNQAIEFPLSQNDFINNVEQVKGLYESIKNNIDNKKSSLNFKEYIEMVFDSIYKYGLIYILFESECNEFINYKRIYNDFRKMFFVEHINIIHSFIDNKSIRPVDDIEYTSRMIIEIITWWAVDIRYKTFERIENVSYDRIKAVCLDNILNAYSIK